ncbi:TetR/AcrR family transcriptional regulator [Roseobacteraceae bacterium S113]
MAADGGQATPSPQVRKGRKFDQVLAGARDVFMAHGFEGASVDDIARAAGVSKATLYSYFPDKRLLFMEVAKVECARQAEFAMDHIDDTQPLPVVLRAVAHHFLGFILTDFGQSIFRISVAESDRFPDLGLKFYESGPMILRTALVQYFQEAAERGEVQIEDYELAAEQFAELCKTDIWMRRTFGIARDFSEAEVNHVVENAILTWMARYGT